MNLNEAQKETVRNWIKDGLKLSEIQTRLASDLGLKMTYMEVRFLIDDLKLQPQDKTPEKPVELKPAQNPPPDAGQPDMAEDEPEEFQPEPAGPAGSVTVVVDQLARPGALISGKVTFSDGKSASWQLDQYGRLGVAPEEKGYKPSQPDLMTFQAELQNALAKMGF